MLANDEHGGGRRLTIGCASLAGAALGASVAVNGACLTVAANAEKTLSFDVVPETLARTNLGALQTGDDVNLEPSLRVGDEIGGHLVYGHIDATTVVLGVHPEGQGRRLICVTPPALAHLIAEKGYVALDGVSLTVAAVSAGQFSIALVPETLARTTLGRVAAGSALNLEVDPLARYAAHALHVPRH